MKFDQNWIAPLGFVLFGFLFGIIIQQIVLKKLKKLALLTEWPGDEAILEGLRGIPLLWCILLGMYGAIQLSPITVGQLRTCETILLLLFIISLTLAIARIAAGLTELYTRRKTAIIPSASIFANLVRVVVYIVGFLTMFHSLGVSITPALTALGVGGIAVALALQDTLSNLFSGLQLIVSGQISPGDYVKVQTGEEGHVVDIMWRSTTIRAVPNNLIIIPNSKLATSIVTKFNHPEKEVGVSVPMMIGFQNDLQKVESIVLEVARAVLKGFPPNGKEGTASIQYQAFADNGVRFVVVLRAGETANGANLRHEFIKQVQSRFQKENILPPESPLLQKTETS